MRLKRKAPKAQNSDNNVTGEVDVGPDDDKKFDSFAKDVIGNDADSDDENNLNKKGAFGNEDEEEQNEEEKEPAYMFFDFRRGMAEWPNNAELIDQTTTEKLLEKATAAAEDAAKMKKKKDGDDEDDRKKDGGKNVGAESAGISSTIYTPDDEEDEETKIHPDTAFETLKDGSTALIIKPGFRLRLKLSELLDGGDAKKEERQRKKASMLKKSAAKVSDAFVGPSMWGDDDAWPTVSKGWGGKSKWFKEYVNKYTITMDIKIMDPIPRDGISLFQTALVHTKEDKRSGKTTLSRSEGECLVSQGGGVGMFGTYGDILKAKVEVGTWRRVVVSVSCADAQNEKGEMRTWVGTETGVVLKEESIVANERFAIDPAGLFLFSSSQSAMMPGNIAIRTMRVQHMFSTDKEVKANRAKDKVLSMFNDARKKQAEEQRKGLSLAMLFPKPRPMWSAPAFVAMFGDAFIEGTALEGTSYLAWTYAVFNYSLQRVVNQPLIFSESLNHDQITRTGFSDSLHIMEQSAAIFKLMMRMLKTPTDSQLLSFLRKLKKFIQAINVGETLLFPALVEGAELILLMERVNERFFKVVVIQTDPYSGLRHHSATPVEAMPEIRYRTCMVLNNVPKKNAMDDVFWMALYNMAIHQHPGDIDRFYDVLLPFLTGKPLEASLVEAETAAQKLSESYELFGSWRAPQRSNTAYVRCILEAFHYLLIRRGVSQLQAGQIHLAICVELVSMMENDLSHVLPHESDLRVCEMAIKELSRLAVSIADQMENKTLLRSSDLKKSFQPTEGVTEVLNTVHSLVENVNTKLRFSKTQDIYLPPKLLLDDAKTEDPNERTLTQFRDMLAWDVINSDPDPGQSIALRKYVPVDLLQIPKKATTRREAIQAIRQCDRLASLIDNQTHCIKNDKFLIAALIEHVFTQVVPVPKPRGLQLSEAEIFTSGRLERRANKKEEEALIKAEAKKLAQKQNNDKRGKKEEKDSESTGDHVKKEVQCFGDAEMPNFADGKVEEAAYIGQSCIWDEEITYELQVELLLTLQRLTEHFVAAFFSIQQSRSFDSVGIIVAGCITAVADAVIRKIAIDEPSEICSHLMGKTVDGRQLGLPGFGISVGTFATQSETIEIHTPELCVARTAILDYFQSPFQRRLLKIFAWEEDFINKPGKPLIRFIRMVSREIALPISKPHMMLYDAKPISSQLMKNYPELKCYRDIAFWWKYLLNPDRKVFPNYFPAESPRDLERVSRMNAQLNFDWDDDKGGFEVTALGLSLHCRPDPKQVNPLTGKVIPPENLPTHRFPSTATPSFYVPPPAIKTEDDVIYRPNLPTFEDKYGQVLNQRDSELLISYLTVPYIRLPLLLTFFSTEDRIHKLQSAEIRLILDSVMFEPGKYLRLDMTSVEPVMVPTQVPDLLATAYGLLLSELYRSPDTIICSILTLLKGAFACDTGSVTDEGATDFNTSTSIILYMTRLGARVDNYLSFLIDWSLGRHQCIDWPLREVYISQETLSKLQEGRYQLRSILDGQFDPLFEDYLKRLDAETSEDPSNEALIDRNSSLACDLHSHKLLLYRNYDIDSITPNVAKTLLGSFVYLTTRHTWNKSTKEGARLKMPETELYELLQTQRRRLVTWMNNCRQGVLDEVMQTALQVSSSLTGSLRSSAAILDDQNRWSRISGDRSCGRWAVGSTRTTAASSEDNTSAHPRRLERQKSYESSVGEVSDTGMLGVEMDLQVGQMTLRSKHLAALLPDIANHADVKLIFGDATIQASLVESAEHRQKYRLVGLNHEIEYWPSVHAVCPPLGDEWDREYDPAELFESEKWITSLFEPIRKTFFDGPRPPPMQFMMTEKPLANDAEVAVILGLHQILGGPFKLVYLFRRLRCVHVYECVSHGREWWYSLHLTTDYRFTLRDIQPSTADRQFQYPDWWIRGAGKPYPVGIGEFLTNDINGEAAKPGSSVLVIREHQHVKNLSGGRELLVPSRLLYGLIPHALLESYTFWQDESILPRGTSLNDFARFGRGYKRLRGYPKQDDGEFLIFVELNSCGNWESFVPPKLGVNSDSVIQITQFPGRTVRITRMSKTYCEKEFATRKRLASIIESVHLLSEPKLKKRVEEEVESGSELQFKVDSEVECDYEGKGEYWPSVVRRANDNNTYDLEFVSDYKWLGVQKGVNPAIVQKRGEGEKKRRGEGVWHFEGMSESEDEYFRPDEGGEKDESENKKVKDRLSFYQFDELGQLLDAANGDEELCASCINRIGSVPGVLPFNDVSKLASSIKDLVSAGVLKSSCSTNNPNGYSEEMVLLNLLYAPRRSRLHSLLRTLSRIENAGYTCAWTRATNFAAQSPSSIQYGCPDITLVELPRLKLSFTAREDHEGILRLFSVDHVDLFIANVEDGNASMAAKMLSGIPHSLFLSNVRGELNMLVPVIPPTRPRIMSEPFSTFIVLDRSGLTDRNERYFLYPVHVSLSFLLTKGLNSAVYLMLLRLLHRDYDDVFRLADSISTDTQFNKEGLSIFNAFGNANDDRHPNAHACRLKICLVTMDSGTKMPFDLTEECSRHIVKLDSVSSSCRLAEQEELQLLESDLIVLSTSSTHYNKDIHDEYIMTLCYNRQQQLRSIIGTDRSKSSKISCRLPPRALSTNWPYYQDNTVFGENYLSMKEITSYDDGDHPWVTEVKGGDDIDSPPEGWLVVACFHTLWSAGCMKVMPAVTELVPMYQDVCSFLSVRADCQGMISISKKLEVSIFPTFIVYRGGQEVDRIQGHERVIEKLMRSLGNNLKDSDKICHAKRRHRIRLEKAMELGLPPPEDEIEEKGQLSWTWDPEQCGENMQIKANGTLAALVEADDEEEYKPTWQYSTPGRNKWQSFSPATQIEIEKSYKAGLLYTSGYCYFTEVEIFPEDVEINSYDITGFSGYLKSNYHNVSIRRQGDRCVVPGEDNYLSKEQKEKDKKLLEWKEKWDKYKKGLREKRYGNDLQGMRGTIGMLPNTGVHTWTLNWNHEPSRFGVADCFGICSDACESWGPGPTPLLGGMEDLGASLVLYASGDLYHKGFVIKHFTGDRRNKALAAAAKEEERIAAEAVAAAVELETNQLNEVEPKSNSIEGDTCVVNSESVTVAIIDEKNATATPSETVKKPEPPSIKVAPLFGKGSKVRCELDTESSGGTITFLIDGTRLEGGVLTDVYSLLGGSEIFPCLCLCPFDSIEVEPEVPEIPTDEHPNPTQTTELEEANFESELQKFLRTFPSVTLLPHDDEIEKKCVDDANLIGADLQSTESAPKMPSDVESTPVAQDTLILDNLVEKSSGATDDATISKDIDSKVATADAPVVESAPEAAKEEIVADVPIEKVKWMYDSESGWQVYSIDASRQLEEAMRDGKSKYLLTLGEVTHTCNLETKKLILDTGDKEFRIRRHVIGDGLQGMWELLSMRYEKPMGLSGLGLLKVLEKAWSSNENMAGQNAGFGFLLLYSLLSGDVRAKVTSSEWVGGGWKGSSNTAFTYGGKKAFGSSSNDSHRFGLLLTQLYADKHTKSLPASIINVLGRNRQVSLRMPKFKDTRKAANSPFFNGWADEMEPRSPLAELFSRVVPLMTTLKRKGAFHFPPPPPHEELPPPPSTVNLSALGDLLRGSQHIEKERPELSDYSCDKRIIAPLNSLVVAKLASSVNFRLGKDIMKPELPTHIEDLEHFKTIFELNPARLLVVNFGANYCHFCATLAPVFRRLSLDYPVALFLKIDITECEDVVTRFDITTVPTVIFLRGGITPPYVNGGISGGGANFVAEFTKKIVELCTPDELEKLKRFHSNAPGDDLETALENLTSSKEQIDELSSQPLRDCGHFVSQLTRQELGVPLVNGELAFDVSSHEAANTAPAQSVLARFKDDVAAYALQANTIPILKLCQISDKTIASYFDGDLAAESSLRDSLSRIRILMKRLSGLCAADSQMISNAVPLLELAANWVNINETSTSRNTKIRFLLSRFSSQNTSVWIEFLFGVLLSSRGEADLLKLNPFLSGDTISTLLALVTLVMLRSNRVGHTNRCIGMVISLDSLLEKVLKVPLNQRADKAAVMMPKLIQLSEDLAKTLAMARHYMTSISQDSAYEFDPRYLVFEFVWNIQLRKKQVEIVNDFRKCLQEGRSKVKQMIMGAGKTSVVAPLLALIVADGKSLVLSVVPKALVEMSRTRMRETFACIMTKRIYTLEFDRSTTVRASMRRGLENAAANRGVVVATPTTLKSIMLSYVETLQHLREAQEGGARSKAVLLGEQARELAKILRLFEEGIMLLDEVDLILHPLKSELNFPIGEKYDLDGSEDGERWSLPIHLLDAFLYVQNGRCSVFEQRGAALEVLKRLESAVKNGITERHLQRLPHVTLLNVDYYNYTLKPILAEWTFFWLQKAHLHGIERSEAIQYILDGASAKSDSSAKVNIIDLAHTKALVKLGDLPPEPELTAAHIKTMSDEQRNAKVVTLRKLQRMNSESAANDALQLAFYKAQVNQLELARLSAEEHCRLVNEIYSLDEELEERARATGRKQAEIQGTIIRLHKAISEIECPRDDSLDNCIVVWCSQAFASSAGSGASATPGETSVPTICSQLEDLGLTVRRCSDTDETISRARDLQLEKQLRCVIIGGDEAGMTCGSSCVKTHANKTCVRCGQNWSNHNGHDCFIGGRGSFPVGRDASATKLNALQTLQTLIDVESPYARANQALPSVRTAVYAAHSPVKEDERMTYWKMGTSVVDDPKQLLAFINSIPPWSDSVKDEVNEDDEDDYAKLGLKREESSDSHRRRLHSLKAELEELEAQKAALSDFDDSVRREYQQRAAEKNAELEISVQRSIDQLVVSGQNLRNLCSAAGINLNYPDFRPVRPGPQSGRDASIALAWFETHTEQLNSATIDNPVDETLRLSLIKHLSSVDAELFCLKQMALAAKVVAHVTSPLHKKLLNLCHGWLSTFLPHCLAKVNRVSFGLLSASDCAAALEADPHVPRSRLKLAVPFVGKDVPSKSSEFAHPDIIIGLTVLAYRYSGLRQDDFIDVVDSLTAQFSHEIGPARDRESSLRHENWVYAAGGSIRGLKTTKDGRVWANKFDETATEKEVVQLKFLQKSNEEQMDKLFDLLQTEPLVIHDYLTKTIFPLHMRSQRMKISASGQAVGGDMLVNRRVGFSGTPSDLLPQELGRCDYETGDDGMMLSTVLDRSVASFEHLPDQWTVESVLERIATAENPHFSALIDTGALITGYSNEEVAQQLLDRGLEWCDGVVFLDDQDKQQVLVRATGRIVSADQCGVSLERRFAFYDQIHTTGMDIKHVVNATAVITLGKDMVFRDYVQGAYRMRGIGVGQRIHVYVIPEVRELIERELTQALIKGPVSAPDDIVLEKVVAWLVVNSLRSEQTQWTMLCIQNIGNLYRKNAFKCLLHNAERFIDGSIVSSGSTITSEDRVKELPDYKVSIESKPIQMDVDSPVPIPAEETTPTLCTNIASSLTSLDEESKDSVNTNVEPAPLATASSEFINHLDPLAALKVFDEPIDFSLEASIPDPLPFEGKLRAMLDVNAPFLRQDQHDIGHAIMVVVGQFAMIEGSANRLDTEQEREQEQEQEKEVEQRRDQQIEVEKFVDREYSRQEEVQRPWPFSMLTKPLSGESTPDHPFYPLRDFKLRHQDSLEFPDMLYVSNNYFNPNWKGLRRVKNVVIVMEYAPSTNSLSLRIKKEVNTRQILSEGQENALTKAHALFGFNATSIGSAGVLSREDLRTAVHAVIDSDPTDAQLDMLFDKYSSSKNNMTLSEFRTMLMSNTLHPEHVGRHWVAVSLAEAETIRRILHVRRQKNPTQIIPGHDTELALRYSPASGAKAPLAGDGGVIIDASPGWLAGTHATASEAAIAHNCFRFFDCDMHYPPPALNILVRVLHGSVHDRERFFTATVGCRRRMERKWQETPLAKVFQMPDEWFALKQRAQVAFILAALKARRLTLWEGFTSFDADNNGILSPSEVYGALMWLGVPDLTAEDVADLIEAADTNRDGLVDYREYTDLLGGESTEDDLIETSMPQENEISSVLVKVAPYGADEIREVLVARRQREQARQREERLRRQAYKDTLDLKIFEEELAASRTRKGGANPSVSQRNDLAGCIDKVVNVTDFKFATNQYPIRFVPSGKCLFLPIDSGTAADRPVKAMVCRKKHDLNSYNYYWMNCEFCRKQGTNWSCWNCNFHVCSACYDGDKRGKEAEKRDVTKNPTFLRCLNACNFTLQIPAIGGADLDSSRYTISLEMRVSRLPPVGHLQSLLRFPLPDLNQARKLHRTSVYLNSDGQVVGRPIAMKLAEEGNKSSGKVRPGYWAVVSVVVDPNGGSLTTYINGDFCHESTSLDPADIKLQSKVVILGGGKQAHARGGDIRRIIVHAETLSEEAIKQVFAEIATENPGVGGRLTKLQAYWRGYKYRKDNKIEKVVKKVQGDKENENSESDDEDEEE